MKVFRKKSGPDQKVGKATTAGDGKWKLKKQGVTGKFYAQVGETVTADDDICLAKKSKKTKV